MSCILTVTVHAQNDQAPTLNLGDPAPPLRVGEWIKGTPVTKFEKGHVYVLEFWATWCKPCIAAMPHLSNLAREYKGKVTFIGMDIYEDELKPHKSIKQIKAFVDSLGNKMDYAVATENNHFTVADWLEASDEKRNGIPITFIVNGEGRLAWIGHPTELDEVLSKVVNNIWDVKEALTRRNEYRRLEDQEKMFIEQLRVYSADPSKPYDLGKPESALLLIDRIVEEEPKLKFAPLISHYTFLSLLKTDVRKAYEYGKSMLVTPSYRGTDYDNIATAIAWAEKTHLVTVTPEIYELGAVAYQARIDHDSLSKESLPKIYLKMADWYWLGKNKEKAVAAAQKAIDAMKN